MISQREARRLLDTLGNICPACKHDCQSARECFDYMSKSDWPWWRRWLAPAIPSVYEQTYRIVAAGRHRLSNINPKNNP